MGSLSGVSEKPIAMTVCIPDGKMKIFMYLKSSMILNSGTDATVLEVDLLLRVRFAVPALCGSGVFAHYSFEGGLLPTH